MELGVIGLGRMGGNICRRLLRAKHSIVAFDRDDAAVKTVTGSGGQGASGVEDMVRQLKAPRAIWVMLPAGPITEATVTQLAGLLSPGDTIIDGGNSYYKDDIRRARELRARQINYVDVGTSGGVFGLSRGYCMMIGGPAEEVTRLDPIFEALAPGLGDIPRTEGRGEERDARPEKGYMYCGPAGSGHFVKMVHNGIEYGMMQAYAEGFDILAGKSSKELAEEERFSIDTADVAEVWRRGSVISSWLLDLTANALAENSTLSEFSGEVHDSGEGRWTIEAAIEQAVPVPVLSSALFARFRSRSGNTFGEKLLSAMRFQFGGHVEQLPGDTKPAEVKHEDAVKKGG
ncbi:MAG: phosphogluconate dehydrogenase (NAD(+)-dependent, decarboxylating) [Janthinobacterium lividum]